MITVEDVIDELEKEWLLGDPRMLYIGGSKTSFRCAGCGSNCFTAHKTIALKYRCNGCGETYSGGK